MKDGNLVFKKDFDKTAKDLKKKNIGEYREKNKKFEEEKLKAYQLQRQRDKEMKNFKKIGKPNMTRIYAVAVKKKEEKKQTLTDEQQDMINYLGM